MRNPCCCYSCVLHSYHPILRSAALAMCVRERANSNYLLKDLVEQRLEEENVRNREEEVRMAAREQTCDSSFEIMESILRFEDIYLEDEAAKSFYAIIKDLNLDEGGGKDCYFRPLSSARLGSFPLDLSHEPTKLFPDLFSSWDKEPPLSWTKEVRSKSIL